MQVERKTLKKSAWTFLAVVDRKKFAGKENKNDLRYISGKRCRRCVVFSRGKLLKKNLTETYRLRRRGKRRTQRGFFSR